MAFALSTHELLTTAHKIMTVDAELVSGGQELFWNKWPSGLSQEEIQWYNRFRKHSLNLDNIPDVDRSNLIYMIIDYVEMRAQLKKDEEHDQKLLMALQLAFIIIMTAARKLYPL